MTNAELLKAVEDLVTPIQEQLYAMNESMTVLTESVQSLNSRITCLENANVRRASGPPTPIMRRVGKD